MKKMICFMLAASVIALSGCGKSAETPSAESEKAESKKTETVDDGNVIKIGILADDENSKNIFSAAINSAPAKAAVTDFELVEYENTEELNKALINEEIDGAEELLQQISSQSGITSAGSLYIEPMGIYSSKIPSLNELDEGLTVGVPSDEEKQGRALLLFQNEGLITLNEENPNALGQTLDDISVNDPSFSFQRYSDEVLSQVIYETDLCIMDAPSAEQAGLNPANDAIALEGADSQFAAVIAIKAGSEENNAVAKITSAFFSDEVRNYITETYNGSVIPLF